MSKVVLMAVDELGDDFHVCTCDILASERISRAEKSAYAVFLVERKREEYPEASCFHFEKEYSYFDEEACFDYFYSIAEEETETSEEAYELARKWTDEAIEEHFDLGFDY